MKGGDISLAGALIHCDKIFAVELKGNRALVKTILEASYKTLDWINSSSDAFKKARLSGIKVLFPLIAISKVYQEHKIPFDIPEFFKKQDSISLIVTHLIFTNRLRIFS